MQLSQARICVSRDSSSSFSERLRRKRSSASSFGCSLNEFCIQFWGLFALSDEVVCVSLSGLSQKLREFRYWQVFSYQFPRIWPSREISEAGTGSQSTPSLRRSSLVVVLSSKTLLKSPDLVVTVHLKRSS